MRPNEIIVFGCFFFIRYSGVVRWGVYRVRVVKRRRNNDLSSATSCIQIVYNVERRSLHHALALDLRL